VGCLMNSVYASLTDNLGCLVIYTKIHYLVGLLCNPLSWLCVLQVSLISLIHMLRLIPFLLCWKFSFFLFLYLHSDETSSRFIFAIFTPIDEGLKEARACYAFLLSSLLSSISDLLSICLK
jgi:hypothetical protein